MRRKSLTAVAAFGAATLIALGCSTEPIGPSTPASLPSGMVIAAGSGQIGVMAAPLRTPISVKVTDQDGAALPGAVVAFAVTGGGGHLVSATATSDDHGLASTSWTLGSGAIRQTATASVPGHTVTFTAFASVLVTIRSGDSQTAEVAQSVGQLPTVAVRDAAGHPVAGLTVQWAVTAGGGSASAVETTTDSSGEASTSWLLGPTVGTRAHALRASVQYSQAATFTASGVLTAGTLSVIRGDRQSGFPRLQVPVAPAVLVTTPGPSGVPVKGVVVHWEVAAGGGTITLPATTTSTDGTAAVGWTLGGSVGTNNQELSASVDGLTGTQVSFTASVITLPRSIYVVSGNWQSGELGTTLADPLVVLVTDDASLPLAGAAVKWEVFHDWGYGDYTTVTNVTDALGHASTTVLLQGHHAAEGSVYVRATVQGIPVDVSTVFTETTLAGPARSVVVASGNAQTGRVGTLLTLQIGARVMDQYGNPKSGVTVQWAASPGSGSTTLTSSVTDSTGVASTGWTIGTTVGTNNQTATATVTGLVGSPVLFVASATAGP